MTITFPLHLEFSQGFLELEALAHGKKCSQGTPEHLRTGERPLMSGVVFLEFCCAYVVCDVHLGDG